jgi:hypothetical protein
MESKINKIIENFITESEVNEVINCVDNIDHTINTDYHHMIELTKVLKGNSHMYDISNTELTNFVTNKQSGNDVVKKNLPKIFYDLLERISDKVEIPTDNSYLQIVDMNKGGIIKNHYDIGVDGYVNFKCNISVLSEEYELDIDNSIFKIKQKDLYAFEASLYKHGTRKEFNSRRILLSYGFLIPYELLGRSENDPRVRLSKRIEKYFQ